MDAGNDVTLGGERLGSGKKMKVELRNYERSTQNLDYIWRSTMSCGTLVPFLKKLALPGDTFDIDIEMDGKTLPTVGPMFGSIKWQMDVFLCPIRLYQAKLHNNELNIGLKMQDVKFPIMSLQAPIISTSNDQLPVDGLDNAQVNPSCLLSYMGVRGIGWRLLTGGGANGIREFNALPVLMYWDIFKNYYSNKQEENAYVIHTEPVEPDNFIEEIRYDLPYVTGAPVFTVVPPFQVDGILFVGEEAFLEVEYNNASIPWDDVFIVGEDNRGVQILEVFDIVENDTANGVYKLKYNFLRWERSIWKGWRYRSIEDGLNYKIDLQSFPLSNLDEMRTQILQHNNANAFDIMDSALLPYINLNGMSTNGYRYRMGSQEGLAVKCYQSDLLNNWLDKEKIDGSGGINEVTSIDTSGGSFTINDVLVAEKVYKMLNRIAVSDGTYSSWLVGAYDHGRYTPITTPMYMGSLIREMMFQEVVSNSEAGGTQGQPLGTLAGKGVMTGKKKGGSIVVKVDEPSYIIGIVSGTPRLDYSQGNDWDMWLKTMNDPHKPALDQIGFEDLITEQMAWWDTWEQTDASWLQKSAGKQPAWINYMTSINKTYGDFAIKGNSMFMTFNRQYEKELTGAATEFTIGDLTTYIDPRKINDIFAQTSLDSQNFWVQIAVDIKARRKMSAKIMPNL